MGEFNNLKRWHDDSFASRAGKVAKDAERWVLAPRGRKYIGRRWDGQRHQLGTVIAATVATIPVVWAAIALVGLFSGVFM